jgi:hypothetical protein
MPENDLKPRKRTLTDADLAELVKLLDSHPSNCNLGLTPDQASILKRFLAAWDKATSIVGGTILIGIIGVLGTIFVKGFWTWLKMGGNK